MQQIADWLEKLGILPLLFRSATSGALRSAVKDRTKSSAVFGDEPKPTA